MIRDHTLIRDWQCGTYGPLVAPRCSIYLHAIFVSSKVPSGNLQTLREYPLCPFPLKMA